MRLAEGVRAGLRWFLRLVYLVFTLVLGVAAFGLYLVWQLLSPAGPQGYRSFTLAPGTTAVDVSQQLERAGFIRSSQAFRLMLRATHTGDRLQAGEHRLSPSMTCLQIRDELMTVVRPAAVAVTLPEGLTVKEVVARINHAIPDLSTKAVLGFTLYPHDTFPNKPWLPSTDLEGYLFPDTYDFEVKVGPKKVVEQMLGRFEDVVLTMPDVKAKRFPGGLTFHETITLASLVEAEASVDKDRPLIAGVYINRLKKSMRMECDATILYALGVRKVLSLEDLKYESPYNTYLHDGLPPGPICNPGRKSIEAALHPRGDFLFYVRNDVKGDKSHVFARTFSEHQENIRRYAR